MKVSRLLTLYGCLLWGCFCLTDVSYGGKFSKDGSCDQESESEPPPKRQCLGLSDFEQAIQKAVDESSAHSIQALYMQFKDSVESTEEWKAEWEKRSSGSHHHVLWGPENDETFLRNLGGTLFLEASVNLPHLQLIKIALLPLRNATPDTWAETYTKCLKQIRINVDTHHYFRRTGALYGLMASATAENPIAHLLFLTALQSVWQDALNLNHFGPKRFIDKEDERWFGESFDFISNQLARQKAQLDQFIEDIDLSYENVSLEEQKESSDYGVSEERKQELRLLFEQKRKLGLPYYSLLLANTYKGHAGFVLDQEALLNRLFHYTEALEGNDPRGGYLFCAEVSGTREDLDPTILANSTRFLECAVKLGDPGAARYWQHISWVWKTPEDTQRAIKVKQTFVLNYKNLINHFKEIMLK